MIKMERKFPTSRVMVNKKDLKQGVLYNISEDQYLYIKDGRYIYIYYLHFGSNIEIYNSLEKISSQEEFMVSEDVLTFIISN